MSTEQINEIVKTRREKGAYWYKIVDELNTKNLKSPTGRPWSAGSLCGYALSLGLAERRFVRGPRTKKTKVKAVCPPPAPQEQLTLKPRPIFTDEELEIIMKCDLPLQLKLKIVRA